MLAIGGLKTVATSITSSGLSGNGVAITNPSAGNLSILANTAVSLASVIGGATTFNLTGSIGVAGLTFSSANGSNAIIFSNAGARLKLSSGGTTDYLSSNGTTKITAAGSFGVVGDFDVNGVFSVSSGTPGVIRYSPVGTRFINMQDAAGITYSAGTGYKHVFANVVKITTSSEPAGPSEIGDMYMTAAGVLKVCTSAGTPGTWVSVGAQV